MRRAGNRKHRQRGVAVITALLLTTLAITIVASLFWQQQVQVRSIENQRLQLQKQWVLRGALDWARLILREDRRTSEVDHLDEPWAVPLAPTRLDQYVEEEQIDGDMGDAQLAGGIVDAQSRYNLQNLANNGAMERKELAVFQKLLENLKLDPKLAIGVADMIATTQEIGGLPDGKEERETDTGNDANPNGGTDGTRAVSGTNSGNGANGARGANPANATDGATGAKPKVKAMPLTQVDDLLSIAGMKPEVINILREFVVVLPKFNTEINGNTASAEVLSARIATLTLADAKALVAARERAYFRGDGDFQLGGQQLDASQNRIGFRTEYFFVNGKVRLGRGNLEMTALIQRPETTTGKTQIVWVREN